MIFSSWRSRPDGERSTVVGEPITTYATSSGGAASYRRLARELIARGGAR